MAFPDGTGLDPALIDLASKVSNNAIYILGRDEIVRYGLESSDRFGDAAHACARRCERADQIISALTDTVPIGGQPITAIVQVACSDLFGYRLTVLRPLPKDQFGQPPPAHWKRAERESH